MSRFVDRFQSHAIHGSINTIESILNELLNRENLQSNIIEELEQSRHVLDYLKLVLENCEPSLVSPGVLNSLNDNMARQIINELSNFRSNNNHGHLVNANNHFDNNLATISSLVVPQFPRDIDGIKQSIITFKRLASRSIRETEAEFKRVESAKTELEKGFSQISSTVEEQRNSLEQIIDKFQQDYSIEKQKREEEFGKEVKERFDQFETFTKQKEDNANQLIKKIEDNGLEQERLFVKKVEEYIDKLDSYKSQAERIMNAISNTSMVGRYQEVANQEKDFFLFWRRFTIGSMILLCVFSIVNFFWFPITSTINWGDVSKRMFVAITLATLAGFASRQAKIHLEASRKYRKMELELTSLNPYLLELGDDKRKEILAEMAGKFFGKEEVETPSNNSKEETKNMMDIAKLFLDNLQTFIKNKPKD